MVLACKEKESLVTQSLLKKLFHYNPDTGEFTRLVYASSRAEKGDVAGSVYKIGYRMIVINYRRYLAHRLAWLYVHGVWPNQIDHTNHDRDDNRIDNLRNVTCYENAKNQKRHNTNKSGVTGVYWIRKTGNWQALIRSRLELFYLGTYTDKFEAICARKSAELKYGFHPNHGRTL